MNTSSSSWIFYKGLTDDEIAILSAPVNNEVLTAIVGSLTEVENTGFGRVITLANSQKYGPIIINYEKQDGKYEILKCVVKNNGNPYVLFGKYKNKGMNELWTAK